MFWDWWQGIFGDMDPVSFFNFSFLPKYGKAMLQGVEYTLILSVISVLLAVLPALVLAVMRLSKSKLIRFISGAYIALFRSTPMMVQLTIMYFGVFYFIEVPKFTMLGFIDSTRFIPGVVTLSLNSAAYVAEIFRAGILAVDHGQMEASRSLGLSYMQSMKMVILPQAVKNVLPALANEIITMVKESSVCMVIGMGDIMFTAKTIAGSTYISVGPFIMAAIIYFLITFPTSKVIESIERKMRRGDKH